MSVLLCVGMVLAASSDDKPHGLMVELLARPELTTIRDGQPEFAWVVPSGRDGDRQTAYRILVAESLKELEQGNGALWDSGKVSGGTSVDVSYGGKPLPPESTCWWKVKCWRKKAGETDWSEPQRFQMAERLEGYDTSRYPLQRSDVAPARITVKKDGNVLIDFGKVAFGYLVLDLDAPADGHTVTVHLGERGDGEGVNRSPGGTVRYYQVPVKLAKGRQRYEIHAPRDGRNTGGNAIRLPEELGIIAPFRFVELENCPVDITADMARQVAIHYPFDEDASRFVSSSDILNQIWDLCKYSMKATSFCGVYVDGDRERIPYEADAYINQLSHYAVDREYTLARYSHEYLMTHPTWPTEWKQHSVLMAWADYMYTGNPESAAHYYDMLREKKTLEDRAREDGLLNTKGMRDIVDWPSGERDGYDFREINTVVNAFYYRTLIQMADLADAVDKADDAVEYRQKAARVKDAFNKALFDEGRGIYVDGEGSTHASLHANMMPLAFDLVPDDRVQSVADFVVSRGMACSVYGAQYLMEGLYKAGRAEAALDLMLSTDVRSWYNMIRVGSTITLEAWDNRFKPNQDWNHAWGAVPGNIIRRYLLGVRPIEPGFSRVLIRPMPGSLSRASATFPTIRGPIDISMRHEPEGGFQLEVGIPANVRARVEIPLSADAQTLMMDGEVIDARSDGGFAVVEDVGSGRHTFETVTATKAP